VAETTSFPTRRRHPLEVHEVALIALAVGTTLSLLLARSPSSGVLVEVILASTLYGSAVAWPAKTKRFQIRLLSSYAFVVWFYTAVARFTPALGTTLRDGPLLAIDERLFGQTPAILSERVAAARFTDVMCVCYLTYHVYLCMAVAHAALVANPVHKRLSAYLFTGFAIGFAGYLLVPAVGPAYAFPELFGAPLSGGIPTRLISELVTAGSSRYDTFPSLHVLITCILLDHDFRHVRWRFLTMMIPSLGLFISTIYLRYHYGVDVLVAFVLFLVLRTTFLRVEGREVRLSEHQATT
jgi:hypothetical protein